ncbi:hypothetical protein [Enterococcus mundtii]|uniref:hypothetical protein n=1 Tax=Enterococcus mundtii TaxID=53346 RepID=UPI000DFC2C99|nr:hypothetical protein [Enterococcus mundtii]STD27447.1 Uncharacterised protein [Enterococcus mundtii]
MFFETNWNLHPMKYRKEQEVKFNYYGEVLQGVIEILDFGGSFEHDYHSYDIYVEESNTLYKHIPEADVFEL